MSDSIYYKLTEKYISSAVNYRALKFYVTVKGALLRENIRNHSNVFKESEIVEFKEELEYILEVEKFIDKFEKYKNNK